MPHSVLELLRTGPVQGDVLVSVDGGLRIRQGIALDHHVEGQGHALPRRRQALGVRIPRAGATSPPFRLRRGPREHRLCQLRGKIS